MARKTTPLTATQILQAKPKEKEYSLLDGDGLALRIKPNGSKLWLFNYYRPITRKRANLSIGKYPSVSLAKARTKAIEARGLLADGIDPKEHRDTTLREKQLELSNTLQSVFDDWLEVKKTSVKEQTAKKLEQRIEKYLLPDLGKLPLGDITAPQAIKTIKPIANQGKLETVGRLCRNLNEIMTFAVNTGVIEHNKLAGIGKAFETAKVTNQASLTPDELPELPELLKTISYASIKPITRCLLEWQLHTMTRPAETAGARWDEIDREKMLWIIPAERMKKGRLHTVPLTKQTLDLLETIDFITGDSEFLFPADKSNKNHINKETANKALVRMGMKGRQTSHGLRALASTTLNEQNFDPDIIEAALSHVDRDKVRSAYNRTDYLERRKVLMAWWSDHIEEAATGSLSMSGKKSLKVVG
ncbi:integrase domain-containing protein [Vibrio cyclitrophicus]|uniref:integrase domain-containing protein n=1 Tax=Vibrio cyclitrophicus TaxID=47951 RepID=UPI000C81B3F9|nr:integrase domain-containing protein [Vibrio cyclitrophicus]PMF58573.1 integrase [Vibrio cyclitrophicus]PMG48409.1 integrase [Vibrio cyclitrophicus]PMI67941.1 integrase [Vibrio cyclitrophicus]PMK77398.1 integrase [Vibrio cyclitrophicus]